MKNSRFSEEQIIGFLKQAEAGMPIKELCRNGGFSDSPLIGLFRFPGPLLNITGTSDHQNMHVNRRSC